MSAPSQLARQDAVCHKADLLENNVCSKAEQRLTSNTERQQGVTYCQGKQENTNSLVCPESQSGTVETEQKKLITNDRRADIPM